MNDSGGTGVTIREWVKALSPGQLRLLLSHRDDHDLPDEIVALLGEGPLGVSSAQWAESDEPPITGMPIPVRQVLSEARLRSGYGGEIVGDTIVSGGDVHACNFVDSTEGFCGVRLTWIDPEYTWPNTRYTVYNSEDGFTPMADEPCEACAEIAIANGWVTRVADEPVRDANAIQRLWRSLKRTRHEQP